MILMSDWQLRDKKIIGETPWQRLEEWHFIAPNGEAQQFTMNDSKDVVIVFGVHADGRILLIREFYPSVQKKLTTMVAGIHDQETPEATAKKELREEAGCSVVHTQYLGSFIRGKYEVGVAHFVLATGLTQIAAQSLDASEDIDVMWVTRAELAECIRKNELQGALEIGCALMALRALDN